MTEAPSPCSYSPARRRRPSRGGSWAFQVCGIVAADSTGVDRPTSTVMIRWHIRRPLVRVVPGRAALIPFLGRRFTVVGKPSQASEIENRRGLAVDFEKTLVAPALEGAGDLDLGQAKGVGDVLLAQMEGEGAAPPPWRIAGIRGNRLAPRNRTRTCARDRRRNRPATVESREIVLWLEPFPPFRLRLLWRRNPPVRCFGVWFWRPPPRRTGTGRLPRSPIHQYSVPHG